MALVDRRWIRSFTLVAGLTALPGCMEPGSQMARDENRKMDALLRCGNELERQAGHSAYLARSQGPEELPPVRIGTPKNAPPADPVDVRAPGIVAPPSDIVPTPPSTPPEIIIRRPTTEGPDVIIRPASNNVKAPIVAPPTPGSTTPAPSRVEGDTQVRIVASIGNTPVYESEVREAVYQRLGEFIRLGDTDRVAKEKAIFREELKRIIERELVLDEMVAVLTAKKQTTGLSKLREAAAKEADQRLRDFKRERGVSSDEEFRSMLRSQGLTVGGIRRQIERGFMMQTYLRQKFESQLEVVSLAAVRAYYDTHADEFKAEDYVKWQDLFVLAEKFPTLDEAKRYTDGLVARAQKGEDFSKLATQYSQGDSASRNGAGIGEKPGDIFPPELEPSILAMKQGQISVKATSAGFHILRVAERTYAGKKPFDEKLQSEIRRKVQNQVYDREVKRLVETLWKRIQPQIWIDA